MDKEFNVLPASLAFSLKNLANSFNETLFLFKIDWNTSSSILPVNIKSAICSLIWMLGFLLTLPETNNSSAAFVTLLLILKFNDGFDISSANFFPSKVLGLSPSFFFISAWSADFAVLFKMYNILIWKF